MPKITWNALIDRASGKLGGSTFKRHKTGQLIIPSQKGRYKVTARTQLVRGILSNLAGCWYQLPSTYRVLWNKYAAMRKDPCSGYNEFIRLNARLLNADNPALTQIDFPPRTPSTPQFFQDLIATKTATSNTLFTWTAPALTFNYVQIFSALTMARSYIQKEKWSLACTVCACLGYCYHSHGLDDTTKLSYRLRVIDTWGRVTPYTNMMKMPKEGVYYDTEEYDVFCFS